MLKQSASVTHTTTARQRRMQNYSSGVCPVLFFNDALGGRGMQQPFGGGEKQLQYFNYTVDGAITKHHDCVQSAGHGCRKKKKTASMRCCCWVLGAGGCCWVLLTSRSLLFTPGARKSSKVLFLARRSAGESEERPPAGGELLRRWCVETCAGIRSVCDGIRAY